MAQEIGESREEWGWNVWKMVENFANNMKAETQPYYIVYACKQDRKYNNCFRQTIKAYYGKPEPLLGILVWYVDNEKGILEFQPELSAAPDVPINETLLSKKDEDFSPRIAKQGEKLGVLLS